MAPLLAAKLKETNTSNHCEVKNVVEEVKQKVRDGNTMP